MKNISSCLYAKVYINNSIKMNNAYVLNYKYDFVVVFWTGSLVDIAFSKHIETLYDYLNSNTKIISIQNWNFSDNEELRVAICIAIGRLTLCKMTNASNYKVLLVINDSPDNKIETLCRKSDIICLSRADFINYLWCKNFMLQ